MKKLSEKIGTDRNGANPCTDKSDHEKLARTGIRYQLTVPIFPQKDCALSWLSQDIHFIPGSARNEHKVLAQPGKSTMSWLNQERA